ncbi:hypothetical protein CAEBREN_03118 [Caenorhabditis brenneri]|uniref:F-box domain-containing protein n=1 Tax=Caenorhabditis brenneri TaxID=135651 RepID=G0N3M6_CAEBE|nr:hypothetical protein CAEBREN_03118 [Caenorhabditis brenneri]
MPLPNHQRKRAYNKTPKYIPLNFLRIPYLAQKKIVAQINVFDSIVFSLNCERYRQVLLKAKVKSDTLNYQFTNDHPKILIVEPERFITVLTSTESILQRQQPNYRLSGVKTEMEITRAGRGRGPTNSLQVTLKVKDQQENTALDALKLFTYHLLEFLVPSKVMVYYNRPYLLNNVLHWNHVPKYHQVEIGHNNAIEGISLEEKQFLLEEVKMKHLSFQYPNSSEYLVPSLRRWLTGENVEYQVDQVSFSTNMSQYQFTETCRTLDAVPTGFTEEDIISRQPFFVEQCTRGTQRDVTRERDGNTVTLIYFRYTVTLLFWNQETLKAAGRL